MVLRPPRAVDRGGEAPHHPDMEARLARVERNTEEIKAIPARLEPVLAQLWDDFRAMKGEIAKIWAEIHKMKDDISGLRGDIAEIRGDIREIKGKLSQMPTLWQLCAVIVTIFALAFTLLRYGIPAS